MTEKNDIEKPQERALFEDVCGIVGCVLGKGFGIGYCFANAGLHL